MTDEEWQALEQRYTSGAHVPRGQLEADVRTLMGELWELRNAAEDEAEVDGRELSEILADGERRFGVDLASDGDEVVFYEDGGEDE